MTIISMYLEWQFHLDITSITLWFSAYPITSVCETRVDSRRHVSKHTDCHMQSPCKSQVRGLLTSTLKQIPIDIIGTIPMGFRAGLIQWIYYRSKRLTIFPYRTCLNIQYLNIWEICGYASITHTSTIIAYSALSMPYLDNTPARDYLMIKSLWINTVSYLINPI